MFHHLALGAHFQYPIPVMKVLREPCVLPQHLAKAYF